MYASTVTALAVLGLSAFARAAEFQKRATCNIDNCLRAVRASSRPPGPDAASSDCASFLQKTVTPCATSVTRTVYITSAVGKPLTTPKTTAPAATCPSTGSATDIPYYATACPNTSRYASACSCAGVTAQTTTLSSTTTTLTTTSTVTQAGPISTFCNKVILSVVNGVGASYVFTSPTGRDLELGDQSQATTYIIENGGLVDTDSAQGAYLSAENSGAIYPIYQLVPPAAGFTTLVCSVANPNGNGAFTCTYKGGAYNFVTCPATGGRDPSVLYGAQPAQSGELGCVVQSLIATAAC